MEGDVNGKDGNTEGSVSSEVEKQTEKLNPPQIEEKQVAFGFTQEGWLILQVHESQGVLRMLGLLEQAKDIVKVHFVQKAEQMKAQSLVRPNGPVMKPGRFGKFFGK